MTDAIEWLPDDGVPVAVGQKVFSIHDGEPWKVTRHGLVPRISADHPLRWAEIDESNITFVSNQTEARRRHEVLMLAATIVGMEKRLAELRERLARLDEAALATES